MLQGKRARGILVVELMQDGSLGQPPIKTNRRALRLIDRLGILQREENRGAKAVLQLVQLLLMSRRN